jgi:hypothetical protein
VAAAAVLAATQLGTDAEEVRTAPADEVGESPYGLPAADLPRLLVDGAQVMRSDESVLRLGRNDVSVLQAFRPAGRLDGPRLSLATVSDLGSYFLIDDSGGRPVEVRGRTGYVADDSSLLSTRLSVDLGDGTAIDVQAAGLTEPEITGFLDGLEQSEPGGRWTSTVSLHGMSEVEISPTPIDGRQYNVVFDLPDPPGGPAFQPGYDYSDHGTDASPATVPADPGAPVREYFDVNLFPTGFEDRLAQVQTDRPLEMVEVDGVPAVLGATSDTNWFVLLEPEPGRALQLGIGNNRASVDWVIEHAHFVDEATWDAATDD